MIIDITDTDALLFLEFQKNYETFTVLNTAGVFNVRNGKAVLNFDANGTLCDIDVNIKTFKRLHT